MHQIVHEMEADVLRANRKLAEGNHGLLGKNSIRCIEFLGAIGSGKTLIIEKLGSLLQESGLKVGAVVGDVAGDDDYQRFQNIGLQSVNINTGKECHLDAHLVEHALSHLALQDLDVLFIENVGNLVCPADFPLGSDARVVIISVTEGDDMVRKHPTIFTTADVMVVNKADLSDAMEVDPQGLIDDVMKVNPHIGTVVTDARHGVGITELATLLGLTARTIQESFPSSGTPEGGS
jgi:hydrogenase nickel incorporation protein HypB